MLLFVPTRTPLHPCCRPLHPGCPPRACRLAKQQLRILIFPGTEVLWKHYLEVPRPQGHHVLIPSPDRCVCASGCMECVCVERLVGGGGSLQFCTLP